MKRQFIPPMPNKRYSTPKNQGPLNSERGTVSPPPPYVPRFPTFLPEHGLFSHRATPTQIVPPQMHFNIPEVVPTFSPSQQVSTAVDEAVNPEMAQFRGELQVQHVLINEMLKFSAANALRDVVFPLQQYYERIIKKSLNAFIALQSAEYQRIKAIEDLSPGEEMIMSQRYQRKIEEANQLDKQWKKIITKTNELLFFQEFSWFQPPPSSSSNNQLLTGIPNMVPIFPEYTRPIGQLSNPQKLFVPSVKAEIFSSQRNDMPPASGEGRRKFEYPRTSSKRFKRCEHEYKVLRSEPTEIEENQYRELRGNLDAHLQNVQLPHLAEGLKMYYSFNQDSCHSGPNF